MARLTADTATRQIKKVLGDKMSLVLDSKSSEKVDYTITYNKNNAKIKAFFDLQSQLYGFVMFNHGVKTYDNIEVFAEMLNVYMYINTELIPITQQIVELYSRENGLTTKYITFTGNLNEGFTTQFEVAGEARFVFVTEQDTNVFRLTLVESQDKKKYKTLDMYLYLLQPDGTFEKRFMILSAANKLFERCFDLGKDYLLKRVDTNSFVFTYGDLTVEFSLNITDIVEYVIHGVNGEVKEFSFVLDDFLDIDAFITAVLDRIDGKLGGSSRPNIPSYDDANTTTDDVDAVSIDDIEFEDDDNTEENSIEREMNVLDTEINLSDDIEGENDTEDIGTDDLFEANEMNDDIISEDEIENTENTENTDDKDNKDNGSEEETEKIQDIDVTDDRTDVSDEEQEETQDIDDIMDVSDKEPQGLNDDMFEPSEKTEVLEPVDKQNTEENEMGTDLENAVEIKEIEPKVQDVDLDDQTIIVSKLNRDDTLVGLLFNVGGKLYIANIESLKPYRIPYKRLTNTEVEVQKKGYSVWESESRLKTFADDISENTDLLKQLFEMMF